MDSDLEDSSMDSDDSENMDSEDSSVTEDDVKKDHKIDLITNPVEEDYNDLLEENDKVLEEGNDEEDIFNLDGKEGEGEKDVFDSDDNEDHAKSSATSKIGIPCLPPPSNFSRDEDPMKLVTAVVTVEKEMRDMIAGAEYIVVVTGIT